MATPTVSNIYRIKGRLSVAPTDLTLAYPHGGTALGQIGRFAIEIAEGVLPIVDEHYGQPVEFVAATGLTVLSCHLRGWDNDALQQVLPDTFAGSGSGNRVIRLGSPNNATGKIQSGRTVKVLFTADRPTEHPSVILYNAIPIIDQAEAVRFSLFQEARIPVQFIGLRSGSKYGQIGLLEDLELS